MLVLSRLARSSRLPNPCLRPEIFRDNDGAFNLPFHTHTLTHSSHLIPSSTYSRKNSHNLSGRSPLRNPRKRTERQGPWYPDLFYILCFQGDLGAAGPGRVLPWRLAVACDHGPTKAAGMISMAQAQGLAALGRGSLQARPLARQQMLRKSHVPRLHSGPSWRQGGREDGKQAAVTREKALQAQAAFGLY